MTITPASVFLYQSASFAGTPFTSVTGVGLAVTATINNVTTDTNSYIGDKYADNGTGTVSITTTDVTFMNGIDVGAVGAMVLIGRLRHDGKTFTTGATNCHISNVICSGANPDYPTTGASSVTFTFEVFSPDGSNPFSFS